MPKYSLPWGLAVVAGLGLTATTWFHSGAIRGQVNKREGKEEKKGPKALYFGTKACIECHDQKEVRKGLLCSCQEYPIWKEKDKHRDAYLVLGGERSKLIERNLGWKEGQAMTDESCRACHGVIITDEKRKHESFMLEEGVSCVICHGAYEDWVDPHGSYLNRKKWRELSRTERETEKGMTDLWNPVRRTELCASCHIGNHKEKKFITHEMYAAGHPPLPGFEVALFGEEMPRHWILQRKKDPQAQKDLQYNGTDRELTRLLLVGAATSLRESMRLLHSQAVECQKGKDDTDKASLDLSNFDCYACHHDLKSKSWRQERGFSGKPGRVPMRPWPTALIKLAIHHAAVDDAEAKKLLDEFAARLKALRDTCDAQPYGDAAKVAPAAKALDEWANTLADRLNKKPCDSATARRIVLQLPALYKADLLDYDSARQVAWAFKIMYDELEEKPETRNKIADVLALMEKQLKLKLPSGSTTNLLDDLAVGMKVRNEYDPEEFRRSLSRLADLLGKN
jgi:hypothetical protein